jgi:hypothetical protein
MNRQDITEILLKVALSSITPALSLQNGIFIGDIVIQKDLILVILLCTLVFAGDFV